MAGRWKGRIDLMGNRRIAGHLAAVFTILIWGTTFISTKVLLEDFMPVEILFFRFVMGFAALFLACSLAVKVLGAVKTSVYIYMVPVITVVTSVLVLKETVTWVSVAGTVLAVAGLSLSEYHGKGRELVQGIWDGGKDSGI